MKYCRLDWFQTVQLPVNSLTRISRQTFPPHLWWDVSPSTTWMHHRGGFSKKLHPKQSLMFQRQVLYSEAWEWLVFFPRWGREALGAYKVTCTIQTFWLTIFSNYWLLIETCGREYQRFRVYGWSHICVYMRYVSYVDQQFRGSSDLSWLSIMSSALTYLSAPPLPAIVFICISIYLILPTVYHAWVWVLKDVAAPEWTPNPSCPNQKIRPR